MSDQLEQGRETEKEVDFLKTMNGKKKDSWSYDDVKFCSLVAIDKLICRKRLFRLNGAEILFASVSYSTKV